MLELTKNNIELVPLTEKYIKVFKLKVKDYEKEHQMRMKTERAERKKAFNEMLNKSKSVVADELLFTASHKFFDHMSKEDELFDYSEIPNYIKSSKHPEEDKDNYEMSL